MAVEDELKQARLALEDADRELREVEKRRGQAEQQSQLLRGQLEQQRLGGRGWWCGAKPCRSSSPKTATTCIRYWPTCPWMPANAIGRSVSRVSRRASSVWGRSTWRRSRVPAAVRAQALPGLAERRPGRSAGDAGKRHPQDRPGNPQSFRETFDQINAGLQALFPKVFGGGTAYLELTGEDLLDTGVAIMARPPGRRTAPSTCCPAGKALTALALVFAIFQLNPAPFCMLDEVDAPWTMPTSDVMRDW